MRDSARIAILMILGFREMVAGMPRMTITLNKSKRRVVKALDDFCEEINATAESAQNVIDTIKEINKSTIEI